MTKKHDHDMVRKDLTFVTQESKHYLKNQDPKGKWTVLMTSKGRATTVVATLKVEYNFGY